MGTNLEKLDELLAEVADLNEQADRLVRTCPVCGVMLIDDLAEHARSYSDDDHRVLEVMSS